MSLAGGSGAAIPAMQFFASAVRGNSVTQKSKIDFEV